MGARVVTPQEAPQLHAMIERLCVQADLPKPKIAVANTSMPNAFALGRSPKSATVCATTGIMDLLSPAELEGVMAHELTHVANRDVMVMTLAGFFATIAAYIVQFGFLFTRRHRPMTTTARARCTCSWSRSPSTSISFFLMQALSRYREFAADRGAALITGRPSALSSALMKISGGMARIPQRDLRAAGELNAFFIFPAGTGKALGGLFATHPPMEKRIAALQRLEASCRGRLLGHGPAWTSSAASASSSSPPTTACSRCRRPTSSSTWSSACTRRARPRSSSSRSPPPTSRRSCATWSRSSRAPARRPAPQVDSTDDEFGYRWIVLSDAEMEDLVVGVNAVSTAIQGGGYGERVLCAVFALRDERRQARLLDLQLQARRASTPSCPPTARSSATPSASCA